MKENLLTWMMKDSFRGVSSFRLENTGYDSIVPPEEEFRNSPLINSSPVMPPWSGEPPRKVPAAEETVNE